MKHFLSGLLLTAACGSGAFAQSFQHGVASGDALQDRVILWTRVTPEADEAWEVQWEVAMDLGFEEVVASGAFGTDGSRDWTVKVDVDGLASNQWFYYRFTAGGATSPVGRTRTLPSGEETPSSYRFAVASCANYEGGYFNAYRAIADRNDLQAVLFLGDYIYEYGSAYYGNDLAYRLHQPEHEVVALDDYRARHANYKLDPDLQAAHQQLPWYMAWDDHETVNNSYKGGAENHDPETEGAYYDRLAAALQAYYEWNPVRDIDLSDLETAIPAWRVIAVGDLAQIHFLETRLHARSEQVELPNVGLLYSNPAAYFADPANLMGVYAANQAAMSPSRTMLGADQKAWLQQALAASTATWNVIANQTVMAGLPIADLTAPNPALGGASLAQVFAASTGGLDLGATVALSYDNWDGYLADKFTLYGMLEALNVSNPLVLTGDIHSAWANTLVSDFTTGETIGAEFVTTQIAGDIRSFGVPDDSVKTLIPYVEHFRQMVSGFTVVELDATKAQADYINVRSVQGDAPVWFNPTGFTGLENRATYTLEHDTSMVSYADAFRPFLAQQFGLDTIPRAVMGAPAPLAPMENPAPLAPASSNLDASGCLIEAACNFDPAVTAMAWTSCEFISCSGCTYPSACNFDPAASRDDGTCTFLPSDVDGNGLVMITDLLDLLADFGQSCE